jgi:hypothetical protein
MPFLAAIPAWVGIAVSVAGAAVGAAGSLIGGMQQASAQRAAAAAQEQQAIQARQIANYNASIQRQNAEVGYKMALYQAQQNQNLAQLQQASALANQQSALANQQAALLQSQGARKAYEQGLSNAKTMADYADTVRAQGREEANRKREENATRISLMRSKYGASGVTFEGSPLIELSDAARLAETQVQDVAYVTELESRKQLRAGEMETFKAQFSLIDEYGYKVAASNAGREALTFANQAKRYEYDQSLYAFDSEIAGAKNRIALNEAKLTELAGGAQAYGFEAQAAQSRYAANASLIGGAFGAVSSGISGISNAFSSYTPMAKPAASAPNYGSRFQNYSFGGLNAAGYPGYG